MSRITGFLLFIILIFSPIDALLALESVPNEIEIKRPAKLIVVDAATREFRDSIPVIKHGDEVVLRVENPNVFRESYKLRMQGLDLHMAKLPESLKKLISLIDVTPFDLPVLPFDSPGMPMQAGAEKERRELTTKLNLAHKATMDKLQEIENEFKALKGLRDSTGLVAPLALDLINAFDNVQARKKTLEHARNVARNWLGDGDLADDLQDRSSAGDIPRTDANRMSFDLSRLQSSLEGKSARWRREWRAVYLEWQGVYSVWNTWKTQNPDSLQAGSEVLWLNQNVELGKTWMADMGATITDRQSELGEFIALARIALDHDRSPQYLERRVKVYGDELIAEVIISPNEAGAIEGVQLPETPQYKVSTRIPVIGRWALGISAGLAGTDLKTQHYYTEPSDDSTGTGRIVRAGAVDDGDIHTILLAHYVYTFPHFGIGPVIGITPQTPVRYLAGMSIVFGRRIRLVLAGGIAWGKVEVLNGEAVNKHLINASLDTQSVMKRGKFISGSFSVSMPLFGDR